MDSSKFSHFFVKIKPILNWYFLALLLSCLHDSFDHGSTIFRIRRQYVLNQDDKWIYPRDIWILSVPLLYSLRQLKNRFAKLCDMIELPAILIFGDLLVPKYPVHLTCFVR